MFQQTAGDLQGCQTDLEVDVSDKRLDEVNELSGVLFIELLLMLAGEQAVDQSLDRLHGSGPVLPLIIFIQCIDQVFLQKAEHKACHRID